MGVAALVLGIVALVFGVIPFCGTWAIIPAIVGLVLGIVDCVKNSKEGTSKGKAIAGIVCSAVAIVVIMLYCFAVGTAVKRAGDDLNEYNWTTNNWIVEE